MGARDDSDDRVAAGQTAVGAEDDDGAIVKNLDRTGHDGHARDRIRCGDAWAAETQPRTCAGIDLPGTRAQKFGFLLIEGHHRYLARCRLLGTHEAPHAIVLCAGGAHENVTRR